MAKLATVEALRVRGNIPEDPSDEVNQRMSVSLDAATLYLSSILRTEFDLKTRQDIYWVDTQEFPWTDQFPKYYLKAGFVDYGTPTPSLFELKMADYIEDLPNGSVVDATLIVRDNLKGQVLLTGTISGGSNISIRPLTHSNRFFTSIDYTAGFAVEEGEFGDVYQDVPAWLQEAALMLSLKIYKMECNGDGSDKNTGGCCTDVLLLLQPYIRFLPSALKPLI